ncbi:MAG: KamA family radical SAM protein [Spirochaetota bacterium]
MEEHWKQQMASSLTSLGELAERLPLAADELGWEDREQEESTLRFRLPRYYFELIDKKAKSDDPIRRQCVPTAAEHRVLPEETGDPLAEKRYELLPGLIQRYKSIAVFLATDQCAMYCRHCFRRRFAGHEQGYAGSRRIEQAAGLLASRPEITELLISGGDPLTLSDDQLERMLATFRDSRPDLVIRIGSRMPVVLPDRITEQLSALLGRFAASRAVYLMTQFNHPREITEKSTLAVRRFVQAGIPVYNQSVLLRGVNNELEVLERLFNELTGIGVKPYYLFQGDLAAGTSHFRTSIEECLTLGEQLASRLSGLAMPACAVDLPGGGGKIPLRSSHLVKKEGSQYFFTSQDGEVVCYPDTTLDNG